MKKSILFFALATLPFFAASQAAVFVSNNTTVVKSGYSSTTYTKTIKAPYNPALNLPCNFTIKSIKGTRTIVEVTVSANCSPAILKALATAGRYELDINTMTFPKAQKHIFVNGQNLDEQIKAVLYIGDDVELN